MFYLNKTNFKFFKIKNFKKRKIDGLYGLFKVNQLYSF